MRDQYAYYKLAVERCQSHLSYLCAFACLSSDADDDKDITLPFLRSQMFFSAIEAMNQDLQILQESFEGELEVHVKTEAAE